MVYKYLEKLGISYKRFEHKAVFTVEEAKEVEEGMPGIKTKNLFLRDKNKRNYLLFCLKAEVKADIKKLSEKLGFKHLSFASPEDLEKFLKLKPGSVSPFGLLNDEESKVKLVIDKSILEGESVNFHPNDNRFTLNLKTEDFKKYLDSLTNEVYFL